MTDPPCDRGGLIPGGPVRMTIAVDECIVRESSARAGNAVCCRTDPAHLRAAGHEVMVFPTVLHEEHEEVSAMFRALLDEFMDKNDEALRRLARGPSPDPSESTPCARVGLHNCPVSGEWRNHDRPDDQPD